MRPLDSRGATASFDSSGAFGVLVLGAFLALSSASGCTSGGDDGAGKIDDDASVGAPGGSPGSSGASGSGAAAGTNGAGGRSGTGGAVTGGASGAGGRGTAGGGVGGGSGKGSGGAAPTTDGGGDAGRTAEWCGKPKPGPANTGVPAGVVLKKSGSLQVTTNGAVVEGLDVAGEITILANDVTIRNVRITSGSYYPIRYFDNDNTGLVVEDSEIAGTSDDVTAGLSFANYTARRLNVHGGADGFKADANVLIEDCWIHDLRNGPMQHNDGVQSTGGKGVTLRHNAISGASNACVQTGDDGKVATEDLLIECNWLHGGGWTLNIRGKGATVPKNVKVLNNRFGRDAGYGPWVIDGSTYTTSGNVYDDDGKAVPGQ